MNWTRAAIVLFAIGLIGLLWSGTEQKVQTAGAQAAGDLPDVDRSKESVPIQVVSPEELAKQEIVKNAHIARLRSMEQAVQERNSAMLGTSNRWKAHQLATEWIWAQVVRTNYPRYKELMAIAGTNGVGEVACDICDGLSYMEYCIICREDPTRCPDCRGTGKEKNGAICSTCLGNGRCFICSGSGRMLCPFCDDGMIELVHPRPPNQIPLPLKER